MRSLSRQNQGAFWVAFFWAAGFCHGQRAPEASHIYPPAGQAGTTVDLLLAATDLTPDSRFFFMDERLKLEVVGQPGPVLMPSAPYWKGIKSYLNDPNLTREVRARLTIPSGMPQGMVHWGVANASGAGDTGKFLITNSPVLLAAENHNGPQLELPLPASLYQPTCAEGWAGLKKKIAIKLGPRETELSLASWWRVGWVRIFSGS